MNWYWVVDCSNTVQHPYVSTVDNSGDLGYEYWHFTIGQAIKQWDKRLWIGTTKSEYDGSPDDVLQSHFDAPIYSRQLREALDDAYVTGIQYLPIEVRRLNSGKIGGFSIANILNMPPALHLELSDYDVFPNDYFFEKDRGRIRILRKAVLISGHLRGYDIIRLKEYSVCIYASERFKTLFETKKFTGYSFHEVKVV